MPDRKLLAKVSCGCDAQWSHDGQETAGEGFPVGLLRSGPMSDGKLSAKVSYWHVTQQPHDGQETFTHKKRTPTKGVLLEWQKIILQS